MSENFDEVINKLNTVTNDQAVHQWTIILTECFKGFISFLKDNQSSIVNLENEIAVLREDINHLKCK